jgi:hypothetical protein
MSNQDLGMLIGYLLMYGIGFLICAFITRAIFSIPTIVFNLKCQTMLLEKLARKNGVTEDEINGIRNLNK